MLRSATRFMCDSLLAVTLAWMPCGGSLSAQDFHKTYTPLNSTGPLPSIFVKDFAKKVQEIPPADKLENPLNESKRRQFRMENTFSVDRILRGGNVLYNDSIGQYVNKVLDAILRDKPALREHLQLYIIKSAQVNAFSFDNGVILVNTGLLSQLNNEAELAYILCHEIIHYERKHSVNTYLDYANVSAPTYHKAGTKDLLTYTKDQEIEADTAGLTLFSATGYDLAAVRSSFEVLQYSYLPFDEQEFPRNFFEDGNLRFPKDYFLDKTAAIKSDDNYDDSRSTHPNIRRRKMNVNIRLDSLLKHPGGKQFIVSQTSFRTVREIACFETCRLLLLELDYPNAIYSAFLLLRKYPENLYLRQVVSQALYGIASYNSHTSTSQNMLGAFGGESKYEIKAYSDVEGFSQQVYYLIQKLSTEESIVLALNYSWKLYASQQYTDNQTGRICDSLFILLNENTTKSLSDFSKLNRAEILAEDSLRKKNPLPAEHALSLERDPIGEERTKYDRIRDQQLKEEVSGINTNTEDDFGKYAFVDLLKDPKFTERFQYFTEISNKRKTSGHLDFTSLQEQNQQTEENRKSGKALGISKIVIVEPFYYSLGDGKTSKLDLRNITPGIEKLREVLKINAGKTGLAYTLLDPQQIKGDEVSTYNDFADVSDWFNERILHGHNSRILVTGCEHKEEIIARYGTSYFMWTGVVFSRKKGLRHSETYIYTIVYDLATETALYAESREVKIKDSKATLHSNYFDILNQIHQPKTEAILTEH
jgi:hypothetical protein